MHEYKPNDIIAVLIVDKQKAISCKVIMQGVGMAKSGATIIFEDNNVIWRLGKNGKWPGFVHAAFRGEIVESVKRQITGKGTISAQ